MSIAFVVDMDGVKGAQLRASGVWVDRLLRLIELEDEFIGVGLFRGTGGIRPDR